MSVEYKHPRLYLCKRCAYYSRKPGNIARHTRIKHGWPSCAGSHVAISIRYPMSARVF